MWPHEALDFTPWLLKNVDVLSDLLGMDLVLEAAEHPVGDFSLDLIGRDEATAQTVIVENQLENSDHTHLGQIITYAAGTDPTTIIWITTGFRPEHRAAVDWLNQRTDDNTRVFGVVIHVVKIGDSEPAPNFELVAQPNDWEKQVKKATSGAATLSGKSLIYSEFWEQVLSEIRTQHPSWTRGTTSNNSFADCGLGTSGVVISMAWYKPGLVAQVYFNSSDGNLNLARFEHLYGQKGAFEAEVGEALQWDEMPGRKGARITIQSPFSEIGDHEKWVAMTAWLIEKQSLLRKAYAVVGGVPAQ